MQLKVNASIYCTLLLVGLLYVTSCIISLLEQCLRCKSAAMQHARLASLSNAPAPASVLLGRRLSRPRAVPRCSIEQRSQQPQSRPQVPWQPGQFSIAFTQVMCMQLPIAYGSVGLWAELRGLPVDALLGDELDAVLLGSDLLQLAGVLLIIRATLKDPQPLRLGNPQQASPSTADSSQTSVGSPSHTAEPTLTSSPLTFTVTGQAAAIGAASAAVALGAVAILSQASDSEASSMAQAMPLLEASSPLGLLLAGLSNVVTGPLTEEVVWRGLLFPSLYAWLGFPLALALSSLGFAAYHLSWQDLPSLTALGGALGCAMHFSKGNLLAPTVGHALYNLAALTTAVLACHQTPAQ